MKKHIDAAKRALRSANKSLFFYGSGDDARLLTSDGPWNALAKTGTAKTDDRAVIILPPFAEEMNRCRRFISLTQASLAKEGICSLAVDYYGTGDSAGEFVHARLADWENDVQDACALAQAAGAAKLTLLGVRFGALLAAHMANRIKAVESVYAVAPQESFQRAIRQFIRIASTTQDLSNTDLPGLRTPGAAKRLEGGETVEIGGYQLSSDLYNDFMTVEKRQSSKAPVTLFFVGNQSSANNELSPQENRQYKAFQRFAGTVRHRYINDAQMWYQGIPDEPKALPSAIAKSVSEDRAISDCNNAA